MASATLPSSLHAPRPPDDRPRATTAHAPPRTGTAHLRLMNLCAGSRTTISFARRAASRAAHDPTLPDAVLPKLLASARVELGCEKRLRIGQAERRASPRARLGDEGALARDVLRRREAHGHARLRLVCREKREGRDAARVGLLRHGCLCRLHCELLRSRQLPRSEPAAGRRPAAKHRHARWCACRAGAECVVRAQAGGGRMV